MQLCCDGGEGGCVECNSTEGEPGCALNHGAFFKQYHVREAKLPPNSLDNHGEGCRDDGLER